MTSSIDKLHAVKLKAIAASLETHEADLALQAALVAAYGEPLASEARWWPLTKHADKPDVIAAYEAFWKISVAWLEAAAREDAA